MTWKRGKFAVVLTVFQVILLILFGVFVDYSELGYPAYDGVMEEENVTTEVHDHHEKDLHGVKSKEEVREYYAMFQDVRVMMMVGFGFLMTFLKRYGFSSVALNLLIGAFVIQWATLTGGWILHLDNGRIPVDMVTLIGAEFATAAVLISFGAVLGKASPLQLLVMATIEIVFFQVNELIVFKLFQASDTGDSMVVHVFGAYFGLAVARVIYSPGVHSAKESEESVYHSDLFAMIGTVFLWLFWPSFNSATAVGEGQYRAVVNTYYALASSAVMTFALSSLVHKDKLNMVHIQNATLAGGVAVGTMADMIIHPWGAILIGMSAAIVSVLGFRFLTPGMLKMLKIHDTCGVHNLHGMPGVLSGIGGAITAAVATRELYGNNLYTLFPAVEQGRGIQQQASFQIAALAVSLAMALAGGTVTGFILRIPIWDQPQNEDIFSDSSNWLVPSDGLPVLSTTLEKHVPEEMKSFSRDIEKEGLPMLNNS